MSLESKIDGLKASIDALTLAFEQNRGANVATPVQPQQFAAAPAPAGVPTLVAPLGPLPTAPAPVATGDDAAKLACRAALAAAAQRFGDTTRVVQLLAQYIRPGTQPAGAAPTLDAVEPAYYAQLAAAVAALR